MNDAIVFTREDRPAEALRVLDNMQVGADGPNYLIITKVRCGALSQLGRYNDAIALADETLDAAPDTGRPGTVFMLMSCEEPPTVVVASGSAGATVKAGDSSHR